MVELNACYKLLDQAFVDQMQNDHGNRKKNWQSEKGGDILCLAYTMIVCSL